MHPSANEADDEEDSDWWDEEIELNTFGIEEEGSDTSRSSSPCSDAGYMADSPERSWDADFDSDGTLPSLMTYMHLVWSMGDDTQ